MADRDRDRPRSAAPGSPTPGLASVDKAHRALHRREVEICYRQRSTQLSEARRAAAIRYAETTPVALQQEVMEVWPLERLREESVPCLTPDEAVQ